MHAHLVQTDRHVVGHRRVVEVIEMKRTDEVMTDEVMIVPPVREGRKPDRENEARGVRGDVIRGRVGVRYRGRSVEGPSPRLDLGAVYEVPDDLLADAGCTKRRDVGGPSDQLDVSRLQGFSFTTAA